MTKRRPLLRATAELVNAANGVRPLARQGYLSAQAFAFGWPTSELTPLYLAGSVLDAGRRALRGDFTGIRGRIAMVVNVITWGLLVLIARRNVASKPYFETALRETLGENYETVSEMSQPARQAGGVFRTGLSRRRYVEKAGTICYGPFGANRADIWRRSDLPRDGRAPVLLQVPGGAWAIGMRRPQAYPMLSHLAERGWVCVSIGYRVSPLNTWPDHLIDTKRALAWIKENIAEYGGNPDFVAISGGSAGGHLTALMALTANDPQYQPGFEDADTSLAAAVPIYGRYDWFSTEEIGRKEFVWLLDRVIVKKRYAEHKHVFEDASPINHVRPDAPPFFVLHGEDDSVIPVEEARAFVDALRKVTTSPLVYSEIPHAQHAFDFFGSPRGHYTAAAIERFLSWVHATRG